MKVTKRILAIVMAALMLLGTCGVAASAVDSLQAAINAAGDSVTMTGDTTESVVISKDLTLDLGGYELKSVPGSPAITIENGANVTITNGHVVSQFANVKSLTMMELVVDESPAAILVKGGSVTVDGVRVVGSKTRIPTTSQYYFPTGNAIALVDGASATVKKSSLVGRYGINNNVTNATPGGSVTIEDAILMGFMSAVKDGANVTIPDDTEEVNAADRIEGFLDSSKKLEERERRILKTVLGDRIMIYTKCEQDPALFAYSACSGKYIVTAHEDDSNVWQNNTSTDCSYKFVPEYIRLADGTLIKMTQDGDAYTATLTEEQVNNGFEVKYRLFFVMQPDTESLTNNFDMYLEDLYGKVIKTFGEVYDYALEKYTTYTKMVGDIMLKLDQVGSQTLPGSTRQISTYDEFKRLRRAIVDIGGATCYNAVARSMPFDEIILRNYYEDPSLTYQEGDIVGTIDRVAKLKAELESFMPFSDQSKMADLGYWAFENYEEVLAIMDEALDRIGALQNILDGNIESMIIEKAGLQSKRAQLDKVQKIVTDGKAAADKLLEAETVKTLIQKANNNKSELKPYINKFIYIYNNHRDYFKPENFVNGNLAKAYAVYGGADMDGEPINDHLFGDEWVYEDEDTHCRICERCGAKDYADHDFDRTIVETTCTQDGKTTYTCKDCGYTYDVDGDPATNHNFGSWEFKDENEHERFCQNSGCDAVETDDHHFVDDPQSAENVEASCTEGGVKALICEDCGYTKTEDTDPLDHSYKAVTVDPTCTEPGKIIYTCERCNDSYEVEGDPATGHDFEGAEWLIDPDNNAQHMRTCNKCGEAFEYDTHHFDQTVTPATCTEDGVITYTCRECGYTYNEAGEGADGHNFGDWQFKDEDNHERACQNDGCDATQTAAHDFDVQITEATCTEPGKTTYTCFDCGYTYDVAGDPATGHDFGSWQYADDNQHERFCNNCDETETAAHNFTETDRVEPTCTDAGSITYTCSDCGYFYTVEGDPATGHTPKDTAAIENVVEPTCGEDGSHDEVVYCDVCGEEISRETKVDPATGNHQFDNGEWLIDPDNKDQHMRTCDVCGEFDYAPHDFEDSTETVNPSCTQDGYTTTTYTCKDCEYTYSETEVLPSNGHTPKEAPDIENVVEPTCEEDGSYDEVIHCAICGEELSRETKVDPAIGHDWEKTGETEPTCTEAGVITYTCKNDPSHTKTEPGDSMLGHDFGDWVDDGADNHRRDCSRCDAYETEAHAFGEWTVVREATETEEGEESRTCPICGREETRAIPKLAPSELTLTDSITHQEPANRISVKVPYSRRGQLAVQLTASEDDVTWTSSKPKLMTVDENGNVTFTRLCIFCRSATITATTPDGRTASCVVNLKVKWWQYIIWFFLGSLWF